MPRTLIFEERYGVSIDDFEDILQIDQFIEEKLGRPLKITDRRTSFTMRGGSVLKIRSIDRDTLEANIDRSLKDVEAQMARLDAEERRHSDP